ncbi:MAG: BTAD domain-containing putative transcriptional regulator [Candidatus Baltobacteraceae bacterium]
MDTLRIELLGGRIVRNEQALRIQPRPLELAMAIAAFGPRVSRERLTELLYPEADSFAALLRTRVYACRLRALVPDLLAPSLPNCYALSPHVTVDVNELERLVATGAESFEEKQFLRENIEALLQAREGMTFDRWSRFTNLEPRIENLRRQAIELYVRDGVSREDANTLINLAFRSVESDPCDEIAVSLLMHSQLNLGMRDGALKTFQRYELALSREYGLKPQSNLSTLVAC